MKVKTLTRIITALDCVGVAATAVLAAIETPKAKKAVGFKAKLKVYAPSIAVGALTMSGIISLNSVHLHTERALAAAYISANETLLKRRELEDEELGAGAAKELDKAAFEKEVQEILDVGPSLAPDETKGERLYWDEESHHLFVSTEARIYKAICKLNRQYHKYGRASVNSWLSALRIPLMEYGDLYGWDMEDGYDKGYMEWVDIEVVQSLMKDNTPFYILRMNSRPSAEFVGIDAG